MDSSVPSSATMRQLVERHARLAPDATALLGVGREPLSYSGLYRQINDACDKLNQLGIGRGQRVAIVLPNGPEMLTAFMAVASCATSAPLNPNYRAVEFEFYLSDLEASALVVIEGESSPAIGVAKTLGIPIIELASRVRR